MMNLIAFADGTRDTLRIAEDIREDPRLCMQLADTLTKAGVLREVRREIREPNRV
jgi:hypothetical protein